METPNLEYIDSIAGGDEDFKQQLINILKDEFPKEKILFLNNFNKKEYVLASENVHKIKHKISMLSLNEDFTMASMFEENLKQNNIDLHKKFINCLAKITEFLNHI
jgi:hypothetical protein